MSGIDSTNSFVVAIGRVSANGVTLLGTAFGVKNERVATTAHVVGYNDDGLVGVIPNPNSIMEYQDTTNKQIQYCALRIVAFDPVRDVAVLDFPGMLLHCQPILSSTDVSLPGTPIITCGFPHADTGRLVLTLHSGVVGARVLLGNSGVKTKHIVLNVQTRPGQSGSPVFAQNTICAMVTGAYRSEGGGVIVGNVDPDTLHQTTHAVSAEYIKGML